MAHISVQSVELPSIVLTNAASKSHAHRALVNLALSKKLVPVIPENTITLNLHLHPDVHAKLEAAAATHSMSISTVFAALANAGLKQITSTSRKDDKKRRESREELAQKLLAGPKRGYRPDQQKFWINLASGLYLDKIVMAEASTGVGKGLCIVSAAVLAVRQGKGPVIIAAPTIQTISQLWQEYMDEYVQQEAQAIKAAFLPGKHEFVDDIRLAQHLLSLPNQEVSDWMEAGAPSLCGSALSSSSTQAGHTPRWLIADLREIASDMRAEDFALSDNSSPESKGMEQLGRFRAAAAEADIVFCSQAMLARMSLSMWRMLPKLIESDADGERINNPVVLIDEAHLFESAMASATSESVSLFSLRTRMAAKLKELNAGPKSSLAQGIKVLNKLMSLCKSAYQGDSITLQQGSYSDQQQTDQTPAFISELTNIVKTLQTLLRSGGGMTKVDRIKDDQSAISLLLKSLTGQYPGNHCVLEFSPHVHFPLFSIGPASVKSKLSNIWSMATGGAGLVSATFWLPSWDGTFRADYMRDILNLPIARVDTPPPVVWRVIHTTPTRFMLDKSLAADLTPPDDQSIEKLDNWCHNQATQIAAFSSKTKGGTLVLCTSYAQVKSLGQHLVEAGIAAERIISNSGRLVDDQKKFVAAHASGLLPIWLVLGPGWTGLDLVQRSVGSDGSITNVPAEEDTLLTDLVITRVPFGCNRSVTHLVRMEKNFKTMTYEAMLLLKQGMGRLIRREGLRHRRILVLDGRLQQGHLHPFMAAAIRDAHLLLGKYTKKEIFPMSVAM